MQKIVSEKGYTTEMQITMGIHCDDVLYICKGYLITGLDIRPVGPVARGASRFEN